MIHYTLIRSNRKTLALQVKPDGSVTVRAPKHISLRQINSFVEGHLDWISRKQAELSAAKDAGPFYTEEERHALISAAKEHIPERVAYFASRMNISYGRITIREQKTRWGSCSSKGNLNFNWKLMLLPDKLLDYVVVHELAHRREMNHSPRFWAIVAAELPDFQERRQRLKTYIL